MLIEVLYIPGCPTYQAAVESVRKALNAEGLIVPIRETPITDEAMAFLFRFPGSPTVRINGQHPEPTEQQPHGLACRLYSSRRAAPSFEAVRWAISAAKDLGVTDEFK